MSSSSSSPTAPRVALVTGASQGIGRVLALRLAEDGLNVGLNDLPSRYAELANVAAEIESLHKGRSTYIVLADISSEEDVVKMISTVVEHLGGIDVMVANAGVFKKGKVTETSVEEWDKVFSVNARGTFLCYKHAANQMIKQGRGGRIIGASSLAGKTGFAGMGAYAPTKWAIRGLTAGLACELGPHGITVNAYAPGLIDTAMGKVALLDPVTQELDYKFWIDRSALGRVGYAEDIAGVVSFLASKDSNFITGQSISVNGGFHFD